MIQEQVNDEQLNSLRVMASLTESPLEVKEIVKDWLLLTYDFPVTEEGNKSRSDFYHSAHWIGAVQHTESVYMIPQSAKANDVLLRISEGGKVIVWYAQQTDPSIAKALTIKYDSSIRADIEELATRLQRILDHVSEEKMQLARNMLDKSSRMIASLQDIVVRRGNPALAQKLADVVDGYKYVGKVI